MPEIAQSELDLLRAKAEGFDRLIHDVATLLPQDAAIKKLAGLSFLEALKDYELVRKKPPEKADKKLADMTLDEMLDLEDKYSATIGHR